jgi:hypothetical protein
MFYNCYYIIYYNINNGKKRKQMKKLLLGLLLLLTSCDVEVSKVSKVPNNSITNLCIKRIEIVSTVNGRMYMYWIGDEIGGSTYFKINSKKKFNLGEKIYIGTLEEIEGNSKIKTF